MAEKRERGVPANGEAIRAKRRELGWTQDRLAQAAGVDVMTIKRAEKGLRIDIGTIRSIADALERHIPTTNQSQVVIIVYTFNDVFDETRHIPAIVNAIKKAVAAKSPIPFIKTSAGSVKLVLEMALDDLCVLWMLRYEPSVPEDYFLPIESPEIPDYWDIKLDNLGIPSGSDDWAYITDYRRIIENYIASSAEPSKTPLPSTT